MTTKILALFCVVGLAGICIAQDQSPPSPGASPEQEPTKHRAHKKAESTASTAESAESPSAAASPAASPKAKRTHKKAEATTAASPAESPAAAAAAPTTGKGATTQTAAKAPAPGGGHGLVWVNSETHVYHKEGSRFYGTTKKGTYMTEAEAVKEGDKAG